MEWDKEGTGVPEGVKQMIKRVEVDDLIAPSVSGPCPDCLWLQAGGECTAIRIEEGPGRWVVASQPCLSPGECQYYQSITEVCHENNN